MNHYESRKRWAPVVWLMVAMMALPPGMLQRAQATPSWANTLTHDVLMESFQNPAITSGEYNRFLMTQSPSELIGGGGDDLIDPGLRGNRWEAEPNALGFDRVEWTEQDLVLPGMAQTLPFSRVYRGSVNSYDGPLGGQWDFNWNRRITWLGGSPTRFELDDMGRKETYSYDATHTTWTSPPGRYDHVTAAYANSYIEIVDKDGSDSTYYPSGSTTNWFELTTVVDRNGNATSFVYDGNDRLVHVYSDAGFLALISYDGAGRISNINGLGQDWKYSYDECADHVTRLVSVEGPPYTDVVHLTGGRRTEYAYSDDDHHSMLKGIELPNQAAVSGYQPAWAFEYDSYPTQHLTKQIINGNPLYISYDLAGRVTVVDRESNGTIYEYDGYARITKRRVYYDATDSYDSTWAYDSNGEVTEAAFPNGNRVAYTYDSLGNVLTVDFKKDGSDASPVRWSYSYTTYSRLSTLKDPNGRTWDYDYDGLGNLTRKTAPTVTVPVFNDGASDYNPSNANKNGGLNSTNDGSIIETWAYDEYGNVLSHSNPVGTTWSVTYSVLSGAENPKPKAITQLTLDPAGIAVTHQWVYDGNGHPLTYVNPVSIGGSGETHYFWNTAGELLERRDPGGITENFEYDADGNITHTSRTDDSVQGAGDFEVDCAFDWVGNLLTRIEDLDASRRLTTTYAYDKSDRLTRVIEPGGQTTLYAFDARDKTTAVTRKADSSSDDAVMLVGYDPNGNKISETNPRDASFVTSMSYDGYDRLTKIARPEGNFQVFVYDKAGNLTDIQSFSADSYELSDTLYAYDEANRHYRTDVLARRADLTSSIGGGWQTTNQWRDESGDVLEIRHENGPSAFASYSYDALGRLLTTRDALTANQNYDARQYDLYGRVTRLVQHEDSQDLGVDPDVDVVIDYAYDQRSRLTTKTEQIGLGLSGVTSYEYNLRDQLTFKSDDAGRLTKYEYNEQLWPTRDWIDLPGGSTDDISTDHIYDVANRSITYKEKNLTTGNQLTIYDYDALHRLVSTRWPDGGIDTFVYDRASNCISRTDPNGTLRTIQYDKNDRLTLRQHTLVSNVEGTTRIAYTYDGLDRVTSAETQENTAFTSKIVWTYNTLSLAETERQVINGFSSGTGRVFANTWTVDGARSSVTYPASGSVISYERDQGDRIDRVSLGSAELARYYYRGKDVQLKEFPGSRATVRHDSIGRITSILHEKSSNGVDLAQFGYYYDNTHKVTALDQRYYDNSGNWLTSNTRDKGAQFGYDGASRIVTVLQGVPSSHVSSSLGSNISNGYYDHLVEYEYDETGNRLAQRRDGSIDKTFQYNVENELTSENGSAQTYYQNGGNAGSSNSYKYDHSDRLARATSGGVTYKYHYDALGRLIQRDHALGVSVRFYYDGLNVAEQNQWNAGESRKKLFVYGPQRDELLLYVDVSGSPEKSYYVHSDALGSVQLLVDASGVIAESYRYGAFGETTILDGSFVSLTTIGSPVGNPYRYTARREDIQVGSFGDDWYDYRWRIYRPGVGRFIQEDPLDYHDASDLFVYVGNDPENRTDPLGATAGPFFPGLGRAVLAGVEVSESIPDPVPGGALVVAAAATLVVATAYTVSEAVKAVSAGGPSGGSSDDSAQDPPKPDPNPPPPPDAAAQTRDSLKGLPNGDNNNPKVKMVESEDELEALFRHLAAGGVEVAGRYPGLQVELPDGTLVGLRDFSRSGGPGDKTIDIKFPPGSPGPPNVKVHISR